MEFWLQCVLRAPAWAVLVFPSAGRMLLVQPVQAGDNKSPACESLRGEKQLCSINQNVVIEQSDPSKAGQAEQCWGSGSSPSLVLVWLCKDLLSWMSFYSDYLEQHCRSESCCVCLTGWISCLLQKEESPPLVSHTLHPGVLWGAHNCFLEEYFCFSVPLGPFYSSLTHTLGDESCFSSSSLPAQ